MFNNARLSFIQHNKHRYHQYVNKVMISVSKTSKGCKNRGHLIKICSKALRNKMTNTETIKCIETLKYLNNNNMKDINVYGLLIRAYGLLSDINSAEQTFYNISKYGNKIDIGIINAMLTVYINNKMYDKSISFFKQYKDICNNNQVTHELLLKVCQSSRKYYEFGKQIISSHQKYYLNGNINHRFVNSLINFYGEFNDIS
eukprot:327440_1